MVDRELCVAMSYSLLKKFLFCLDPETAHHLTLKALAAAHALGFVRASNKNSAPRELMGLKFPNAVGLAAGLDKNGDYIDALGALGFGFIEIGTITPKPQSGNPKPRLFRLTEQEAIINRMGFNNKGLDYLVERLKKTKYQGVLGINIGKNRDTPLEKAEDDYLMGFRHVAAYASYVTINISSPNTTGLRELQRGDLLASLIHTLKYEQTQFFKSTQKYVPIVVKIAPDLTQDELTTIAEILLAHQMDGVIATNTTINRAGVLNSLFAKETGGLSGKPLAKQSTALIKELSKLLQDKIPIIGCGGIFSAEDAREKLIAGAKLVQIYSGLIYKGPGLIEEIANE